jgi:hypothetical protein
VIRQQPPSYCKAESIDPQVQANYVRSCVLLSLLFCTLAEAVIAARHVGLAAPGGTVLIGRPG